MQHILARFDLRFYLSRDCYMHEHNCFWTKSLINWSPDWWYLMVFVYYESLRIPSVYLRIGRESHWNTLKWPLMSLFKQWPTKTLWPIPKPGVGHGFFCSSWGLERTPPSTSSTVWLVSHAFSSPFGCLWLAGACWRCDWWAMEMYHSKLSNCRFNQFNPWQIAHGFAWKYSAPKSQYDQSLYPLVI